MRRSIAAGTGATCRVAALTRIGLLIGTAAMLMSCGSSKTTSERQETACPTAGVLDTAGQQSRFRAPGGTRGDLLYEARITGVSVTTCRTERSGGGTVDLQLGLQLVRGPASSDENFSVTYFVAVTTPGGEIVSRKPFTVSFRIPADRNGGTAQEELSIAVPPSGAPLRDYRIYAALQLTPEELEYNRSTGAP